MAYSNTEVIEGLLVRGVTSDGDQLLVDVYGGEGNVCGTIRFTLPDRSNHRAQRRILQRWARDDTPVTYVATGSTITLRNEAALFARQMQAR